MENIKHKERCLVIVLAETRAHEHTFELFKTNVLDHLGADLALCVANNEREDKENPFYQHAKFTWTYDEPDDWGEAFDDIQSQLECSGNWRQLLHIKDQWLGGILGEGQHSGSAGILLFFRLFLKRQLQQSGVLEQYDRFIVTRSDFIHLTAHVPLEFLQADQIWIPNGEDYGGFTDRHIVASRDHILDVLSIADPIIESPEKLYVAMSRRSNWNLERFIHHSFNELELIESIRRFPYTMYSVRSRDGHTRWSKGSFDEQLGYHIKYQSEFACAHKAKRILGRSAWSRWKLFKWKMQQKRK